MYLAGIEFLSKLSEIQLPAELSEMQIKLSQCFVELDKIWNSVNKLAFRFNGDCGMGDLKLMLKQMEFHEYEVSQCKNITFFCFKEKEFN